MADKKNVSRKMPMMIGIVRLLRDRVGQSSIKAEIACKLTDGSVELKFSSSGLEITGSKADVTKAYDYVQSTYMSKVVYDKLEITESDLKMDFTSPTSLQTDVVDVLEQNHQCAIEIRASGSKSLADIIRDKTAAASARTERSVVTAVEGNLIEFQADILVNTVLFNTKDLANAGPLSTAFLAAGGPELQLAFASVSPPVEFGVDVAVTAAFEKLTADKIYHAAFRRHQNTKSVEMLYALICKCLKMAKADGKKTIAFPTLGCGQLGFSVENVADCFMRAARSVGGLQIYIVAREQHIYEIFKEKTSKTASSVVFHVNTLSEDTLMTVREELKARVMSLVLTVPIVHSAASQLSPSALTDLGKLNASDVRIDADQSQGRVVIKASSQRLEAARASVMRILDAEKRRLANPAHIKQAHGVTEYLKAVAKDTDPVGLPSYWTSQGAAANSGGGTRVVVDAGTPTYLEIERMLTDTWDASHVGHGNDAIGLGHQSIAVRKIWRIENPRLYYKYRSKVKELCLSASHQLFPPVNGLDGEDEVMTRKLGLKTLEADLIPEINEYLLLHGTKKDVVDVISNQGLDSRMANNVYFGSGVYCAESSTKSDQYADVYSARVPPGQPLFMYVVRVLMGHPYVARRPYQYRRPPCKQPGCTGADRCVAHAQIHDSIIGTHRPDGTRLLFREFVVYHPDQSYPEYLIEYVRQ